MEKTKTKTSPHSSVVEQHLDTVKVQGSNPCVGTIVWYWQFRPKKDEGRPCLIIKEQENKYFILYGKEKVWISKQELEICNTFRNLEEWYEGT